MNKRKKRQEIARSVGVSLGVKDIPSFESGIKWADFNPNWKEDIPKKEENQYGLPKLYLCQILTLDMTFGYRYSYRVGFINKEGKWNIENSNTKVTRYLEIFCDESMDQLIQKDIPNFEKESEEGEEDDDNKKDYQLAA
jgi:hypothetical protein